MNKRLFDDITEVFTENKWLWFVIPALLFGLCFLLIEISMVSSSNHFIDERQAKWQTNFDKGMRFYESSQLDSALIYFDRSQLEAKYRFDSLEIKSKRWKAECFYNSGNLDSASHYAKDIGAYFLGLPRKKILAYRRNYPDVKAAHYLLSRIYKQQDKSLDLLRNNFILVELAKEHEDTTGLVRGFEQIVLVSQEMNLESFPLQMLLALEDYFQYQYTDNLAPEVAEIIFPKFVDLMSQADDGWEELFELIDTDKQEKSGREDEKIHGLRTNAIMEFYAHLKFSEVLRRQQKLDSARTHCLQAHELAQYINLPRAKFLANLEKGKIFYGEQVFEKSDSIFEVVLEYENISLHDSVEVILALAESLLIQGQHNDFFSLRQDLIPLLQRGSDFEHIKRFLSLAAINMKRTGDLAGAVTYLELRDSLDLEMLQEDFEASNMDILATVGIWDGVISDFESNEANLQTEKENLELQNLKGERSKLLLKSVLALSLITLLSSFIFIWYESKFSPRNLAERNIILPYSRVVKVGDIVYLTTKDCNKNTVKYVFSNGTTIVVHGTSLDKIEESKELPKRLFKRLHRSYIVNSLCIESRVGSSDELILSNREWIKYSRKKKDLVEKILKRKNQKSLHIPKISQFLKWE